MNTIPEDLPEAIKFYLIASGYNISVLDKDFNNSPPGEDHISRIIKKEISKEETLLSEYSLNYINSMIRDSKINDMLPRKIKKEYVRMSKSVLEGYTKENNIEYDFILIIENSETNPFRLKVERTIIVMINSNTEELIQFEEIDINDYIDNGVEYEHHLIPTTKKLIRNQRLKELGIY